MQPSSEANVDAILFPPAFLGSKPKSKSKPKPKPRTGESSEELVLMETHAILIESGKPQKPSPERETEARSGDTTDSP